MRKYTHEIEIKGVMKIIAMITDIKISFQSDNEKIKIIALTGKIGSGIDVIKSYLLRHKRVSPIILAHAGSEELSSNEFLEKIVKGQIIEAYCNEENEIYGTDISQMLSTCLYIGIYTPNQIANMAECPNIELLPIEIDMNAEARFLHLLGYPHKEELTYKQLEEQEITNICKKFLKDNQYDNEEERFESHVLYEYKEEVPFTIYKDNQLMIKKFNKKRRVYFDLEGNVYKDKQSNKVWFNLFKAS